MRVQPVPMLAGRSSRGGSLRDAVEDPTPHPSRADEAWGELPYADDRPPGRESVAESSHAWRSALEWIAIIGGAFVVAFLIKTFLLQAFFIPSESMEPTLDVGDRVLVNKLSYDFHDVHRGDLIVFERPPGESSAEVKDLIKRVIAVGGETIETRDGSVYIDGKRLREPYLPSGTVTAEIQPTRIPDGYVFVMGDNRGDSRDSRAFGPISESLIVGRAFIRVWPLGDISLL